MESITPPYLRYARRRDPFIRAVRAAKQDGTYRVRASLDSFHDDPFRLYTCLWYAYSEGVDVTFQAPAASRAQPEPPA